MAEILKNKIQVGSTAINNIVVTDIYGNKEFVKFVKSVNENSQSDIKYDTFKEYVYSDIVIDSVTCLDIDASGGSVKPNVTYHQIKTKKGHSGSTYIATAETLSSDATITYYKNNISDSNLFDGNVSTDSLGNNTKIRTKIMTVWIRIAMNGKTTDTSIDVYQKKNEVISYSYDIPEIWFNNTTEVIPASGATRICPSASYKQKRHYNYDAGTDLFQDYLTSGLTLTYGTDKDHPSHTETDHTKVTITGENLGPAIKDETILGYFHAKVVGMNNLSAEVSQNVVQSPNEFTEFEYDAPSFNFSLNEDVAASGGKNAVPEISNISQTRYYCFTSGHKVKSDIISESVITSSARIWNKSVTTQKNDIVYIPSDSTILYFKAKNTTTNPPFYRLQYADGAFLTDSEGNELFSDEINYTDYDIVFGAFYGTTDNPVEHNNNFGQITFPSLGNETKARTQVGTTYAKITMNGKTSNVMSSPIYQEKNEIERYVYGEIEITLGTVPDIPASGGMNQVPSVSYTQRKYHYYTSGHHTDYTLVQESIDPENARIWSRNTPTPLNDIVYIEDSLGNKEYYICKVASTNNPPVNYFTDSEGKLITDANGNYLFGNEINSEYELMNGIFYGTTTNPSSTNPNNARFEAYNLTINTVSRKQIGTIYIKVYLNGQSKIVSKNIYQQLNRPESYSDFEIGYSNTTEFAAKGGKIYITPTVITPQIITYTSGGQRTGNISYTYTEMTTVSGFSSSGNTVTAYNNTSEDTKSGYQIRINATAEKNKTSSALVNFTQLGGVKIYGIPSIGTFTYNDALANGTNATVNQLEYSQIWTWNGVRGSGDTISEGATISYEGVSNPSTGAMSAEDLITTDKIRTKIASSRVTVVLNGQSNTKDCDVYQEANAPTNYSEVTGNISLSVENIPASGGTKSASDVTLTNTLSQTITYTSGKSRAGIFNVSAISGDSVTGTDLLITPKAETVLKTDAFSVNATSENNIVKSATVDVIQNENKVESSSYATPVFGGTFSYETFGAAASTLTPNSVPTYSQVRTDTYSSTHQNDVTLTSGGTLTYSKVSGDKFTLSNASTGAVSTSNNTTTSTNSGVIGVTVAMNGKTSARKDTTITQSAAVYYSSSETYGTTNVVKMGSKSDGSDRNFVPKSSTNTPPLYINTDTNGNYLTYSDGEYSITGEENTTNYTEI